MTKTTNESVSAFAAPASAGRAFERLSPEEIPASEDLCSAEELEKHLAALDDPPLSVIVVGDLMLGGRGRGTLTRYGDDYPFAAVRPLLQRAGVVLANLEGPIAGEARRQPRNHSYRVNPAHAPALLRAGIGCVTLANNHLVDCGREGVLETLALLADAGVAAIGAGADESAAHAPVIRRAGPVAVGLLGYYWNRRCAATAGLPGSAMDPPESLAADIHTLRERVDRVVATFHWGVPYEREPSEEDRAKARFAIDCGADAVVGHHPHIVQPFEVYRGRPIFYSVGNFAFGSGNSRAEGLVVGLRFQEQRTIVDAWPLYVKNRDPRVDYQPKVMRGGAAERALRQLATISGASGAQLTIEGGRGRLKLPASRPFAATE